MENITINPTLNPYLDSTDYSARQLILPLDCGVLIEKNDPVRSFCEILEGVNLKAYLKPNGKGRHDYEDLTLLKIVLFAYMSQILSLRDIESACRCDIRFMWLAQGIRPSHMTFQRLINERLKGKLESIFIDINRVLIEKDQVQTDVLYIDGTKLEANATKNSFVWKKAVLKFQAKLYLKITKFYEKHGLLPKTSYHFDDLTPLVEAYLKDIHLTKMEFVQGKGHKKSQLQRYYEEIKEYRDKLKEYEAHLRICGERNSYSKTDHDATFMHSKEDYYMKTGIFKPAYNVQLGVSDEYILYAKVYPNPGDTLTFIPFLESYRKAYGSYPKTPVADAGYGSYENYLYCVEHQMELVQKYSYYESEKHSVKEEAQYRAKSMRQEDGSYRCPQGKDFIYQQSVLKTEGSYPRLEHQYQCEDCTNCPVANRCKKSENARTLRVNPVLFELQDIAKENLDSPRGIELRVQRSIQSESTFGQLKYNWGKTRFMRRGKENVENELFLIAIGLNLMKYHAKKMRKKLN